MNDKRYQLVKESPVVWNGTDRACKVSMRYYAGVGLYMIETFIMTVEKQIKRASKFQTNNIGVATDIYCRKLQAIRGY